MRILCLVDDFPWPEKSGYKIRLGNIVRALAEVGELDLFVRMPLTHTGPTTVSADVAMRRVLVVPGDPPRSTPRMLLRWATTRLPRMLARADWSSARRALDSWADGPYDLVWYGHADSFVELGGVVDAPSIVDLDNLEDQRIAHLRRARAGGRDQIRSRGRALAARTFDRFDQHRWARLQRRIAARVQAVTLCSDLDRARLGMPNVEVLPNGYELPEGAPVHRAKPDPAAPVIGMVGLLTYEPNADGVWFFVDDILPLIRVELPGTRVKLIGRYDGFVSDVGDRDGVELCGEVPDITTALADVDVIVVPVRFGAGTRIKVLEAFARGLPVVSTSVGCEGIPVENGEELLIADDAAGFARACVDLVRDEALRARVVARGAALWQEQFRWSDLRPRIADLAHRAAGLFLRQPDPRQVARRARVHRPWGDRSVAALLIAMTMAAMLVVTWVLPEVAGNPAVRVPGERVGFAQAFSPTFESRSDLEREFDAIAATGARWVRFDFIWSEIQKAGPDSFDWSAMDRAVRAARDRGLRVLATLAYTPEWARPPGATSDKFAPVRLADFARFAREAAARYVPQGVLDYEIWNEPNTTFWLPKPDPARYTRMLRRASTAIHLVDADATVVGGVMAPQGPTVDWVADDGSGMSPLRFLREMYTAGAHGTFDALGFHPYALSGGPRSSSPASAFGQTPRLHREMAAHGDRDLRIWGTETGAYTGSADGAVSQFTQARRLVETVTLWQEWSFTGPLFVYSLRDRSRDAGASEDHFGVLRVDYMPKDAYSALQRLLR